MEVIKLKDNKNKENTKNRNNKKDKDRNKKVLLWIIIVALSLVIFGTVVYTVIKEKKDEWTDIIPGRSFWFYRFSVK